MRWGRWSSHEVGEGSSHEVGEVVLTLGGGGGPHMRWGRYSSHEVGEVLLTLGGGGVLT